MERNTARATLHMELAGKFLMAHTALHFKFVACSHLIFRREEIRNGCTRLILVPLKVGLRSKPQINGTSCKEIIFAFKVIPQYCIAHFLLRIILLVISARKKRKWWFFPYVLARERDKSSFSGKRVPGPNNQLLSRK